MDEGYANIDIVFRNGLKDFEVLPPPEAWENLRPVIKRRQRPYFLMQAAAVAAVAVTLSFFAYRWSTGLSEKLNNTEMAMSEESVSPSGVNPVFTMHPYVTGKGISLINNAQKLSVESGEYPDETQVNIVNKNPDDVLIQEPVSMMNNNTILMRLSNPLMLNSSIKYSNRTLEIDKEYIPGDNPIYLPERWSVTAMASPTYYSKFNTGSDELSKQLMSSEHPVISYSGGFAFAYKINRKFSIQAGLYYSSLGQEVSGINSFGGFQKYDYTKGDHNFEVLTSNGNIYTSNADVFLMANGTGQRVLTIYNKDVFDPAKASLQYINNTIRQDVSYLEFPVIIRYKFLDKVIDLNLIGGLSYNLLVNNFVYTMNDGVKYPIGKTAGLNPITLSSSFGMGMEYNFSENFSFNLEPTIRYYLNPFIDNSGFKIHPYSFGIFSGISYKF